jgi:cytochrome c oxidase cbb3-type subunit 3
MSVDERDPHSGYKTTGHEWNGIKELNTPVPRPVYFFLIAAFLFSVVYWVLMPAWPTAFPTPRACSASTSAPASRARSRARPQGARPWTQKLLKRCPLRQALADPALMTRVRDSAPSLFGDNCAMPVMGRMAAAHPVSRISETTRGYGAARLTPIAETIRIGVNSGHADAHCRRCRPSVAINCCRKRMYARSSLMCAPCHAARRRAGRDSLARR